MLTSGHTVLLPYTQEELLELSLSSLLGQQALLECRAGEDSEAPPLLHTSVSISLGLVLPILQDGGEGAQQHL